MRLGIGAPMSPTAIDNIRRARRRLRARHEARLLRALAFHPLLRDFARVHYEDAVRTAARASPGAGAFDSPRPPLTGDT